MAQRKLSRRSLLAGSGTTAATSIAGITAAKAQTLEETEDTPELRTAETTPQFSSCAYCGVGCPTRIHVMRRNIINIEGNTDDVRFNGALCARGASQYQIHKNPYRGTSAVYRDAGSDTWQYLDLDEAIEMVAERIKRTRDRTFRRTTREGAPLNAMTTIGSIGGARMSNEANYLLQKLLRGLGIVRMQPDSSGNMADALEGLRTRLGYAASTTTYDAIADADAVLLIGTDPGEEHPVLMQHLMQARSRGVPVISTESVLTRTGTALSLHAPVRPGTEIALVGALVRYILEDQGWQQSLFARRYLDLFTNAATLVHEDFEDTEDLDGVFSGLDEATLPQDVTRAIYQTFTWTYQASPVEGNQATPDSTAPFDDTLQALPASIPEEGASLENGQTVYQILRRHFSRYTPEMVTQITGCPEDRIEQIANDLLNASTTDRTSLVMTSGGRGHGAQMTGALALLQLLLGNIGRPGGGVIVTGPDVNSQGSQDLGSQMRFLPGQLPAPSSTQPHATLVDYIASEASNVGESSTLPAAMMSYLIAMYGDNATSDTNWGYDWFPRLPAEVEQTPLTIAMEREEIEGLLVFNDNPAAGGPNSVLQRAALQNLDWLVVKDLAESETAAFWKDAPELQSGSRSAEDVDTEVFYFPSAQIGEQTGSWTNAERRVVWSDTAVDPAYGARSDLWFINKLAIALRRLYSGDLAPGQTRSDDGSEDEDDDSELSLSEGTQTDASQPRQGASGAPDPFQYLAWDYAAPLMEPRQTRIFDEPSVATVHAEINGYRTDSGEQLSTRTDLADDGSTACGCRHYVGIMPAADDLRAARRGLSLAAETSEGADQGPWGYVWPEDTLTLYNRASADADGVAWSEAKSLVWWDPETSLWTGIDVPDIPLDLAPDTETDYTEISDVALGGTRAFRIKSDGRGWLFSSDALSNGPLPTHYEPIESPVQNLLYAQNHDPLTMVWETRSNTASVEPNSQFPHLVHLTSLAEHHTTGELTRWSPWLNEQQPAPFCEISPSLAATLGVVTQDYVLIRTPRSNIYAQVLVTPRVTPLNVDGTAVEQVALPGHWGFQGLAVGPVARDITLYTHMDDIPAGSNHVIMARLERL